MAIQVTNPINGWTNEHRDVWFCHEHRREALLEGADYPTTDKNQPKLKCPACTGVECGMPGVLVNLPLSIVKEAQASAALDNDPDASTHWEGCEAVHPQCARRIKCPDNL